MEEVNKSLKNEEHKIIYCKDLASEIKRLSPLNKLLYLKMSSYLTLWPWNWTFK